MTRCYGYKSDEPGIRDFATAVGVAPRDVTLAAGATARVKRLVLAGDPPTLIAALEKMAAAR